MQHGGIRREMVDLAKPQKGVKKEWAALWW
jgi:hypothetical protein